MSILGVDIGTTAMKMRIYRRRSGKLIRVADFEQDYEINTYNDGMCSDIEQEKWKDAFVKGCRSLKEHLGKIEVIALSGTTPGLTAMDSEGEALYPAILMLDQRSRRQAKKIVKTVGIRKLMAETGNMPVAGGCSLASILWIKSKHPGIFKKTSVFGHTNTYIAKWLTGNFAIDPSSASLTALYNTVKNDMTWNETIANAFDLSTGKLPPILPSHKSAGRITKSLASRLGFKKEPYVMIGGNDAVLAAYSVGVKSPGDIINVNGTCEITLVCLPRCINSQKYNVRAHVIPGRWLTLYVMNAGGKAYEWFHNLFCSEMSAEEFFNDFMPSAIDTWLERDSGVTYVPYLMGSRYSQESLKASFTGLTPETTREELITAVVRGLCWYQRAHLKKIGIEVHLAKSICVTGGAVNPAIIRAKKKWMRNCDYHFEEQSSVRGAAMLGLKCLEEES